MISELTEMTESREVVPPKSAAFQTALRLRPDRSAVCKPPLLDVPFRGWIFYDRACGFCSELALRFENVFAKRGFQFEPLQQKWVQERLNLTRAEALEEMRVLISTGEVFGGADAVIFLARQIWWAAPLGSLARLSLVHGFLDRAYRWVAAHRTCAIFRDLPGGTCFGTSDFTGRALPGRVGRAEAPPSENAHGASLVVRTRWFAMAILPPVALCTKPFVPAWVFMWLMAGAIFFGCKWLTLGNAVRRSGSTCPVRAAAYLLAWPGMSAARFLSPSLPPPTSRSEIVKTMALAVARILLGALLVFSVARHASEPILAGWIGMVGMVLILHFGLFELASVGWGVLRVDALPIMNRPLRSTSVSEFWGRRWNAAFNDLAVHLIFRPMARATGPAVATLIAFAFSGLIHELVISLPAGAGFGLPTAYFLVQGLGVLTEHSSIGRRLGLNAGIPGWLFTMVVVAGPAYSLFHPPFVRHVILPFMRAIGAL
jgi:alginate O-acetyltransferase complex protein AlgI